MVWIAWLYLCSDTHWLPPEGGARLIASRTKQIWTILNAKAPLATHLLRSTDNLPLPRLRSQEPGVVDVKMPHKKNIGIYERCLWCLDDKPLNSTSHILP
ncbi:hypothetical protein HRR84_006831 [Exophiala dermatitidis]|nr:hypothetical protein HRR84_006831 [Exophiala dermatitidis]